MPDIQTEQVSYAADGVEMNAFLARDADIDEKRPGVLVTHEWWGCNEYAQRRARALAGIGYTSMALDLYGGGRVAANPDEAGELMAGRTADMDGTHAVGI